jgi:amino acid adenylation domain-containing protein
LRTNVYSGNDTPMLQSASGGEAGLFARFARAATASPDRIAVEAGGEAITFAELKQRACRLASYLHAQGVAPECHVGIYLHRSVELVVALLAVLKLGAAYVPLDPAQPKARLSQILTTVQPAILLTRPEFSLHCASPVRRIELDQVRWQDFEEMSITSAAPENVLYTIFTSGSTGVPKGVQVSFRSASWLLNALEQAGVIRSPAARVAWNASIGFDASVQQWLRLCRGDSLYLLDEDTRRDPSELVAFLHRHRIDDLDATPSHLRTVLDHLEQTPVPGLRILLGGEAIPAVMWDRLRRMESLGMDTVNVYGPTEATVDALWTALGSRAEPTLGNGLPGVKVTLRDRDLKEVATGMVGQICLSGTGLARGYLARPGLTSSRFVPCPEGPAGSRMYLTGDMGRLRSDGALDYLGRADYQVKVRGHRVELGEVETVLLRHAGVHAACVLPGPDDSSLCAFLCLSNPAEIEHVKAHARAELPDWMCPSRIVLCDEFPLTPSGKLDRIALASRLTAASATTGAASEIADQRIDDDLEGTALRNVIAAIWLDVLRAPKIAPEDNFFSLGGNSLAAMQVGNRLQVRFRRRVPTRWLFEHPTLDAYVLVVAAQLRAT